MNTWFVGNIPIGHYCYTSPEPIRPTKEEGVGVGVGGEGGYSGKKVFFMKARIMAGQANLKNNKHQLQDFQWLTKEEVEQAVAGGYWRAVKHLLVAQ